VFMIYGKEAMAKPKILFVDDEENILHALKWMFRRDPYETFFAESGKKALELMQSQPIHIIVTDLMMPEMNGLELLDEVEAKYPDVVRLVLAGGEESKSILAAVNKGNVYRYVLKPWNTLDLKMTISQAAKHYSLQREKNDLQELLKLENQQLEIKVSERTEQLLAVQKKAEVGKYASQIVHNLNSPLQVIINAGDILGDFVEVGTDIGELKGCIDMIRSSARDLEKIIIGILNYSRVDSGDHEEEININKILDDEIRFFSLNAEFKHKIVKNIDLAEDLPLFKGNPMQIKQVVDNLINNAIDAVEHTESKEIGIITRVEDDAIALEVSDSGVGIREEHLDKIFIPDFTTKSTDRGTGLGLASVKRTVESYSGEISVSSTLNQGSTFVVKLPIKAGVPELVSS